MAIGAIVVAILEAISAIPKIGDMVGKGVSAVVLWWAQRQDQANQGAILDALAFGMKAKDKESRLEASKKWQEAISRPKPLG
jgi:hypothetical protein